MTPPNSPVHSELGMTLQNMQLCPEGEEKSDQTPALQKHLKFFDTDNDGVVYPWDSYRGLRAIGCGCCLSMIGTFVFNFIIGLLTRPGKGCCCFFPIDISNISNAEHGSDSGVYDSDGRFVESKFEGLFQEYAYSDKNSFTFLEILQMLQAKRRAFDFIGWVIAFAEWMLLYILGKDDKWVLQKDTVRGVYDGTLFSYLANKKAARNHSSIYNNNNNNNNN